MYYLRLFCILLTSLLVSLFGSRVSHSIDKIHRSDSLVTWDRHSLVINGERVFIQSGEFHPWRLPVVPQWTDILQKFSAAGLNTVSIYGQSQRSLIYFRGLVNPIEGKTDWTTFRSLQPIFDAARSVGLYVIVRPGPYINAGGIPGWVTAIDGPLRTNSTSYAKSWKQYWIELADIVRPNQIDHPNGTVIAIQIENEYLSDHNSWKGQPAGKDGYMQDLSDMLRENGIIAPLTFNDAGMELNFVRGQGSVDIYGLDSYPQSFNCSEPDYWKPVVENYAAYQEGLKLDSPLFIPEFQAGAFDPWGGSGYDNCRKLTGPQFESVFNLNNLAANLKMVNYYMVFGGTSWGYLPFPGVYTSYDYGAAISENRDLTEKYDELKRQSLFLRSSPQFYHTVIVGNSSTSERYFEKNLGNQAFVTELRNPNSGAGFYIVRARNSTSKEKTSFQLHILTSKGPKRLPIITLPPRQSKILVTDYSSSLAISSDQNNRPIELLYTTANVLLSAKVGGNELIYLFSNKDGSDWISEENEQLEISRIKIPGIDNGYSTLRASQSDDSNLFIKISEKTGSDGYRSLSWSKRHLSKIDALCTPEAVVIVSDKVAAGRVWNPIIFSGKGGSQRSSILVWGPWLVRTASLEGSYETVLRLNGDFERGTEKEVVMYVGNLGFSRLEWNGIAVKNIMRSSCSGFLSFYYSPELFEPLRGELLDHSLKVGARIDFENFSWTYRNSLPEIQLNFSDVDWLEAKNQETKNPYKKLYGKYYLYACDYGFCNGATIWRGRFNHRCTSTILDQLRFSSNHPTDEDFGFNLTISGGESFVSSVWVNEVFLGNVPENKMIRSKPKVATRVLRFSVGDLNRCQSNVITVVQDNMGMDQTEDGFTQTVSRPRGILGYKFEGQKISEEVFSEIEWKVQGQLGGFHWLSDPERGIMNENGIYGIRSGFHLPSYELRNSSEWVIRSPIKQGQSEPGIGFYHTEFDLKFPRGYDVMMSFEFLKKDEDRYRVEFWVNGWHSGRMIAGLGPQTKFPVHQGILNYSGKKLISLTLWSLESGGSKISGLSIVVDKVLAGGIEI
ncbi:glycoside hydrolase superfamily [Phakopsora pachyrhizi]|nr:glycoside hydrolase superfamily [Phakopsora pachyrhizi]